MGFISFPSDQASAIAYSDSAFCSAFWTGNFFRAPTYTALVRAWAATRPGSVLICWPPYWETTLPMSRRSFGL